MLGFALARFCRPGCVTADCGRIDQYIELNGDKSEVKDLLDISGGTNITFDSASQGRVDFFEGTNGNYRVGSLKDNAPSGPFAGIQIYGTFVRTSQVPEPTSLTLLALGLLGLLRSRQSSICSVEALKESDSGVLTG